MIKSNPKIIHSFSEDTNGNCITLVVIVLGKLLKLYILFNGFSGLEQQQQQQQQQHKRTPTPLKTYKANILVQRNASFHQIIRIIHAL